MHTCTYSKCYFFTKHFFFQTKKIQVSDLLLRAPLALAEDDAESHQVGD